MMYRRVLRCCSHDYLLDEGRLVFLVQPEDWRRPTLALSPAVNRLLHSRSGLNYQPAMDIPYPTVGLVESSSRMSALRMA